MLLLCVHVPGRQYLLINLVVNLCVYAVYRVYCISLTHVTQGRGDFLISSRPPFIPRP